MNSIRPPPPGFAPVTRRAGAKRRTPEAKPEGLTGAKGAIRSPGLRTVVAISRRGLAGPGARGLPRPSYRARARGRGVRLTGRGRTTGDRARRRPRRPARRCGLILASGVVSLLRRAHSALPTETCSTLVALGLSSPGPGQTRTRRLPAMTRRRLDINWGRVMLGGDSPEWGIGPTCHSPMRSKAAGGPNAIGALARHADRSVRNPIPKG